jgi:hypothetical protein
MQTAVKDLVGTLLLQVHNLTLYMLMHSSGPPCGFTNVGPLPHAISWSSHALIPYCQSWNRRNLNCRKRNFVVLLDLSVHLWHNPFLWVLGCVRILSGRDEGLPSGSSSGRPPWPGEARKACPASKSQATLFACCDGLARACDVALRPLWLANSTQYT